MSETGADPAAGVEAAEIEDEDTFTGQGLSRFEDRRILTGEAEFIHDKGPDHCREMTIVRSVHAHADIIDVDTSEAEAHPGCDLVLTVEDIKDRYNPMPCGIDGFEEWSLADEKVRFVGEPVAVVVAENRYLAEDIADLVDVDYETRTPVVDGMAAREDEQLVHEDMGTNVADHEAMRFGDPETAFEDADHVVEATFEWGRLSGVPLETAGVVARYDEEGDAFFIDCNIQLHTLVDDTVYETLGWDEDEVHLDVPPDVGGSFGTKIAIHRYVNLAAMAAHQAGVPVRYVEDRIENLQGGDVHSSERTYEMRLALDDDGIIEGLDVWFVDDFGAWPHYPVNQVLKPLSVLTNAYDIEDVAYEYDLVLTNKTAQTAYRGFGVDPHHYALEGIIDEAARDLDLDPTELRRRNLVTAEQMPYRLPSNNIYDSGDYPAALDRIERTVEENERCEGGLLDPDIVEERREEGKYRGTQPSVLIEPGVSGSDWTDRQRSDREGLEDRRRDAVAELPEHFRIAIREDGTVRSWLATDSSGQGHQTLVSQLVADGLGVLPSDVDVEYLDSVDAPTEYGSAASRMAVMLSGATSGACAELVDSLERLAADHWSVDPSVLDYRDGGVTRTDTGATLSLSDLYEIAEDRGDEAMTRTSVDHPHPATREPAFDEALRTKHPVYPTAAFAANAPVVEVDVETGEVEILKFYTVRDCGTMLNPMIVEGQAHGGIAQGVGAALLEEFGYDSESGQPQAITLFDYLLPSITNVPPIEMEHTVTESPFTETGAKGVGEGGMIDAPASIASAISRALDPLGVTADRIPLTPHRVRKRVREAEDDPA